MKIGKFKISIGGGAFAEINRKYREPKIQMTTPVRIALFALRIYLLLLVGLLVFKFITLLK